MHGQRKITQKQEKKSGTSLGEFLSSKHCLERHMSTLAPLFLAKHPDGEERQVIRPNVWETSCADTETLSIFHIEGMADPDLLCRVLNLFAVQSFTPERVRADREDHKIRLLLTFPGLSQHRASVIAEKLRSLVTVLAVRLEFSPHAGKVRPCVSEPLLASVV